MDIEQQKAILERFGSDEAFRKSVLEDAQKAVKDTFGIDLPFPVQVVADGAGYRVEPLLAAGQNELSDEHLELVAGGLNVKQSGDGINHVAYNTGTPQYNSTATHSTTYYTPQQFSENAISFQKLR